MILLLGLMLVAFIGLNMWTKRSNQKRQDARDKMLNEELVAGAWVHTSVGFYGRFVDLDGDVLILETPGGEETYWNKAVIRSIGELPFAAEEVAEDDVEAIEESASAIEVEQTEFDLPASTEDDSNRK